MKRFLYTVCIVHCLEERRDFASKKPGKSTWKIARRAIDRTRGWNSSGSNTRLGGFLRAFSSTKCDRGVFIKAAFPTSFRILEIIFTTEHRKNNTLRNTFFFTFATLFLLVYFVKFEEGLKFRISEICHRVH